MDMLNYFVVQAYLFSVALKLNYLFACIQFVKCIKNKNKANIKIYNHL